MWFGVAWQPQAEAIREAAKGSGVWVSAKNFRSE